MDQKQKTDDPKVAVVDHRREAEIKEFERRAQATLSGHTGDIVPRDYYYDN